MGLFSGFVSKKVYVSGKIIAREIAIQKLKTRELVGLIIWVVRELKIGRQENIEVLKLGEIKIGKFDQA